MIYPIHLKKLNRFGFKRQFLVSNLIIAKELVKPRIPIPKKYHQTRYYIKWIKNILVFDCHTAEHNEALEFTNTGYLSAEYISDDIKLTFPEAFTKT